MKYFVAMIAALFAVSVFAADATKAPEVKVEAKKEAAKAPAKADTKKEAAKK